MMGGGLLCWWCAFLTGTDRWGARETLPTRSGQLSGTKTWPMTYHFLYLHHLSYLPPLSPQPLTHISVTFIIGMYTSLHLCWFHMIGAEGILKESCAHGLRATQEEHREPCFWWYMVWLFISFSFPLLPSSSIFLFLFSLSVVAMTIRVMNKLSFHAGRVQGSLGGGVHCCHMLEHTHRSFSQLRGVLP